jgi:hypothetical protein
MIKDQRRITFEMEAIVGVIRQSPRAASAIGITEPDKATEVISESGAIAIISGAGQKAIVQYNQIGALLIAY